MEFVTTQGFVTVGNEKTGFMEADFISQNETYLHVNKAYFPSWKAYVNGNETNIQNSPTGMDIVVPKGAGTIRLSFMQTPLQSLGNTISIVAFFAIIVGIIFKNKKSI
jgi:uncharacterized membrane protein YfhO